MPDRALGNPALKFLIEFPNAVRTRRELKLVNASHLRRDTDKLQSLTRRRVRGDAHAEPS